MRIGKQGLKELLKTYGSDSIEQKQIKSAMKLNFLTTSGQSEEQRWIYFDSLYERRFNRIEKLINDFKLDQTMHLIE